MKIISLTLFLMFSFGFVFSQSQEIDSLKLVLKNVPSDVARFHLYEELRRFYAGRGLSRYLSGAIGMKVATREGEETTFIITL